MLLTISFLCYKILNNMRKDKIGFIGSGKMGEAIIAGVLKKKLFNNKNIFFYDMSVKAANYIRKKYKINFIKNNHELLDKAKIIVLAVKPQAVRVILDDIKKKVTKGHLIISIAAGIKIKTIKKLLAQNVKVIRVMPNTPCLIGKGISVLSPDKNIDKKSIETVEKIFSSLGRAIILDEKYLNSVTALSGSGPAFVYRIVDAFIKAGKSVRLKENISKELAIETFLGAVEMIKTTGKSIEQLVLDVSSPNGTTVAGRYILEKSNYKKIIKSTIKAAKKRAEELSKG